MYANVLNYSMSLEMSLENKPGTKIPKNIVYFETFETAKILITF